MTTAAIDNELALESARLTEAQAYAAEAAEELAKEPSNPQLRLAVMQAQQAVAEVQIGIDALNAARIAGEKADTKEADEAYRAETVAMFNQAKALVEKRTAAGKAIDTALYALRDAMAAWQDLNTESAKTANAFHMRLYGVPNMHLLGMDATVLNAVADQIGDAISNFSEAHRFINFNHVRRVAGVPESAEKDAKQSSERYLDYLDGFAKAKGVI